MPDETKVWSENKMVSCDVICGRRKKGVVCLSSLVYGVLTLYLCCVSCPCSWDYLNPNLSRVIVIFIPSFYGFHCIIEHGQKLTINLYQISLVDQIKHFEFWLTNNVDC